VWSPRSVGCLNVVTVFPALLKGLGNKAFISKKNIVGVRRGHAPGTSVALPGGHQVPKE
jgi:hypothetical protein